MAVGAKTNRKSQRGFTLLELVVVVAIILVVTAMALPSARNAVRVYRLNAASSAVSGVIQSTRYQAITVGCPYRLTFTTTSPNYQITWQKITGTPPVCDTSGTWTNVGSAVPWTGSNEIVIDQNVTLEFAPSGTVTAKTGSTSFNLTLGTMKKAFTVSGVGNVSVVSK